MGLCYTRKKKTLHRVVCHLYSEHLRLDFVLQHSSVFPGLSLSTSGNGHQSFPCLSHPVSLESQNFLWVVLWGINQDTWLPPRQGWMDIRIH